MKKILLADDNPSLRSALRLFIGTRFPSIIFSEAEDKQSTLAAIAQITPDYLILDWELPGMTGENRVMEFMQLLPELHVIVISARPEVEDIALKSCADAFICKTESPIRFIEVLDTLIH